MEAIKELPKEEQIKTLSFFKSYQKFYKDRVTRQTKLPRNRIQLDDINEAHLKKII